MTDLALSKSKRNAPHGGEEPKKSLPNVVRGPTPMRIVPRRRELLRDQLV
jgi:hypothetical protein